jgi:hypothetical protein
MKTAVIIAIFYLICRAVGYIAVTLLADLCKDINQPNNDEYYD